MNHRINDIEEEMYSLNVALGQIMARALGSTLDLNRVRDLQHIAGDAPKWSDILDFVKKLIYKEANWRRALPPDESESALFSLSNPEKGFGRLFLAVWERRLLPMLKKRVKELGFDLASRDTQEAAEAHRIIMRLCRKAIDQMLAEYGYRYALSTGQSVTAHFTKK